MICFEKFNGFFGGFSGFLCLPDLKSDKTTIVTNKPGINVGKDSSEPPSTSETESDKTNRKIIELLNRNSDNRKEKVVNTESSIVLGRTSKSFPATDIPDSKVGVKDELDCGGGDAGGFFDDFFDYFD